MPFPSNQTATELTDWPQPAAGTPNPRVIADEDSLLLYFRACTGHHIVVSFPHCDTFIFGAPNDEALNGHPLYGRGLKAYSAHKVLESDWIRELERRNSVHPRHNKDHYLADRVHYIVTFHDSTFECVTTENQHWKTKISVYSSFDEVRQLLERRATADYE